MCAVSFTEAIVYPSVAGAGRTRLAVCASNAHGVKIIFGTVARRHFYLGRMGTNGLYPLQCDRRRRSAILYVCSTRAHTLARFPANRAGVIHA